MHFCRAEVLAMVGMRILRGALGPQARSSEKPSGSSILEIDSWMPSRIQAIAPLVDRLMLLIEGSHCIPGEEPDVELALREALANAVVNGNGRGQIKVHIRCRSGPGNEISIVVTDQGKGSDFRNVPGDGETSKPTGEHAHGIELMKAYMDDVYFERGGSEVHMRKRARKSWH
jgi:anti-sigma regulatory factor (Ser/Thr protein kinase)